MSLACPGCGADVPRTTGRGAPRKFCLVCRPRQEGTEQECRVCHMTYKGRRTLLCDRCHDAARYVPRRSTRECGRCGKAFVGTVHYDYCSPACAKEAKRIADNERARIRWAEHGPLLKRQTCKQCGVEFVAPKQQCCSDACRAARDAAIAAKRELARAAREPKWVGASCPVPWADCSWCSRPFVQRWSKKYCSDPCRRALAMSHETSITYLECEHCRSTFVARVDRIVRIFCTPRCEKASRKRMRRHLKRVSTGADRITIGTLGERDGWVCHLCGEEVRRPPWSAELDDATIDHLVPVSKGGSHTWGNVALAHFMCNTLRQDADLEVVAA